MEQATNGRLRKRDDLMGEGWPEKKGAGAAYRSRIVAMNAIASVTTQGTVSWPFS